MIRSERGTAAVEFALIVPALGLLIAVTIGAARVWQAHTVVEQIAATAARAASLELAPGDARAAADAVARDQATTRGLSCSSLRVGVDLAGFQVPVGQPARVQTRVTCTVPLADLLVPGWPGSWDVSAEAGAVLDRYRRRG
ncbi:MAG: pilus assembly protein [Micropruina sp.]|uniref:TadE family protein n=1 Tax=Micropruina sp. TaxID=2737536 RepID=UPI0039E72515